MKPLAHSQGWDGRLPAVLVLTGADESGRRAALRHLAGRVLGVAPDAVVIRHAPGLPPRLVLPDTGLFLSSASRGIVAAVAVADRPVGVDVEEVVPEMEPPWNVLHPDEGRRLRALPEPARAKDFACLWSLKEAFLKALGRGLDREPASFVVAPSGAGSATIQDGARVEAGSTISVNGGTHIVALVILSASGTSPSER